MCQESGRHWGRYSGFDSDVTLWTQLRQMLVSHLDTHVDELRLGSQEGWGAPGAEGRRCERAVLQVLLRGLQRGGDIRADPGSVRRQF